MTAEEADRVAVMRFRNHRSTGVRFHTRVSSPQGPLALDGDVDFRQRLGYAQVSGAGSSFTLQWDATTLLAWPSETGSTVPPAELPAPAPTSRPLAPDRAVVDAVLALLLELGQDRPDNAQLIRQNGTRWLRSDTVASTRVDVIQGPAAPGSAAGAGGPITYWVDGDGRLLRLDARLGGGATPTVIDIDPASFTAFTRSGHLGA